MYHFLVGLFSNDEIKCKAKSSIAGNLESLIQFGFKGRVTSETDQKFSLFAELVGRNKGQTQIIEVSDNGEFSLSLTHLLPTELTRININLFIEFENGKKNRIGAIAISTLHSLPKVTIIVGSPRSGTTAVGNAVQKSLSHKSHGESHLGEIFQNIIELSTKYVSSSPAAKSKGTLAHALSPVHLQSVLFESLRNVHQDYYGDDIVIDKTPGGPMISSLNFLLKIYPQAKVIYCKRRGLENIASRMRKFPKVSFIAHCRQWRNTHQLWRQVRQSINTDLNRKDWFCSIEQYLLTTNLEHEASIIAKHLGLTDEQKNVLIKCFKNETPQKTSSNSKAVSLDSIEWSEDQKETFITVCLAEMNKQKYSLDENYFK